MTSNETFWRKEETNSYGDAKFKVKKMVFIILLTMSLITGIIMGAMSFKQIDYNRYGLQQNVFTKQIDDEVYSAGLHFVGFWNEFIIFPSTYITIDFTPNPQASDIPISVQTKNGLLVKIDTSFQFRLRKSDLLHLYSQYGNAYKAFIIAEARSALREVVGSNNAETLYSNRTQINNDMAKALHDALDSIVEIGEFQLRSIDFPQSFEDAVEQYEVWRVEVNTALLEQQAEMVKQQTLTLIQQEIANRTLIEYEGITEALEQLRIGLGMTNEEMLTYLWIQTIYEHDQAYLFIGMNDVPIIIPIA